MKNILIFTFLLSVSSLSFSQTYFNKRYPIYNHWGGGTRSIVIMNDSLFVNIGSNFIGEDYMTQLFTSINITTGDKTNGILLHKDSTEYFSGSLTGHSNGYFYDVFTIVSDNKPQMYGVVKYTPFGDTIWFNPHTDTALFISVLDVEDTQNEELIFSGIIQNELVPQGGSEDLLLVKTDSLGNEKWRKIIGDSIHFEQGHSVASTPDGGFILGGIKQKEGNFVPWEYQRPWLIKTDSLGNIEWDRFYGSKDTLNLPIYKVITTQEGGYAFVGGVGVKQYVHDADFLPWIVKLNAIGDTLWTRTIYGNGPSGYFTKYKDLIELQDGSLVTCGQQIIPNPDTINFDGPR